MVIRLVKEEAEEMLGLDFSSDHLRRYPQWTQHTYMPVVSPAFTQQAASVRRAAAMRA